MYRACRCSFLRLSVAALGVFCLSATGGIDDALATTPRPPSSDHLCDIPFTVGHRAALIERHITGLMDLLERWEANSQPDRSLDDRERRWLGDFDERLVRLYAAAVHEPVDPRTDAAALPDDLGFVFPPTPSTWLEDNQFFTVSFNPNEIAGIKGALNALTHWSCVTTRIDVVRDAMTVIYDLLDLQPDRPMAYDAWRRFVRILTRQIELHPIPTGRQVQLTAWIDDLIRRAAAPKWTHDASRVSERASLHLAATDWVLSGDGDIGHLFGHLRIRFDPGFRLMDTRPPAWTDPETNAVVLAKAMNAYDEAISATPRPSRSVVGVLDPLDYHMMRLSFEAGDLDMAACFYRKLRDANGDNGTVDGSLARFRDLDSLLTEAYGSDWFSKGETTCD
jgi:hypothetical protein